MHWQGLRMIVPPPPLAATRHSPRKRGETGDAALSKMTIHLSSPACGGGVREADGGGSHA